MKSRFFNLNTKDFIKGLIVAILTGVLTFLNNALISYHIVDMQLIKQTGIAALIGFLSYIIKNLFTNSKDEILKKE